jgi:hypothetical protein
MHILNNNIVCAIVHSQHYLHNSQASTTGRQFHYNKYDRYAYVEQSRRRTVSNSPPLEDRGGVGFELGILSVIMLQVQDN